MKSWHLEYAKERGRWEIYELLMSKKMGNEAVRTVKIEKNKITRSSAIATSFRDAINSKAKDIMEKLRAINNLSIN